MDGVMLMTYYEKFARGVGGDIDGQAGSREDFSSPNPFPEGERDCFGDSSSSPAQRHDGWTPEVRVKFLEALSACGNVTSAAHYVQRSRTSAYNLKRQDADFARTWDAALLLALDSATDVLQDRAINGITEDVYYGGEVVGTRQRYESRYLLAHIARLEKLAERASVSRGAARFDRMMGAIAAEEDTSALISDPTTEEMTDIIAKAEAKAAAKQVEEACERQRQIALYEAIKADEAAEEKAVKATKDAEIEARYGPTYEIDWGNGQPLEYSPLLEDAVQKLRADFPQMKLRRISRDDPRYIAAMGWDDDSSDDDFSDDDFSGDD